MLGRDGSSRSLLWGLALLLGALACGCAQSKGAGSGPSGATTSTATSGGATETSSATDTASSDGSGTSGGTSNGAASTTMGSGSTGEGSGGTGGSTTSTATTGAEGGEAGASTGGSSDDGAGGTGGAGGSGGTLDPELPGVLEEGVWLVGWSGGNDHFSWLEFSPDEPDALDGSFAILEADCGICSGFVFGCEGTDGRYSIDLDTHEILMEYPAACSVDPAVWGFKSVILSPTDYPPDALLKWSFELDGGNTYNAFLYPRDQCDSGFTSCTWPTQ